MKTWTPLLAGPGPDPYMVTERTGLFVQELVLSAEEDHARHTSWQRLTRLLPHQYHTQQQQQQQNQEQEKQQGQAASVVSWDEDAVQRALRTLLPSSQVQAQAEEAEEVEEGGQGLEVNDQEAAEALESVLSVCPVLGLEDLNEDLREDLMDLDHVLLS